MKKYTFFIVMIFLALVIYLYSFNENNAKEINMIVMKENYEELREVLNDYGKNNNLKINIWEGDGLKELDEIKKMNKKNEKLPDIFFIINDWIEELVKENIILEIKESELNSFVEIAKEGIKINEKYYGYPYTIDSLVIYYNKNHIKKIPDSIEELIIQTQELEKEKQVEYGFMINSSAYYYFPFYTYFNGLISDVDKLDSYSTQLKVIRTMQYAKKYFRKCNYNVEVQLFKEEKLAVMVQGTWVLEDLNGLEFEWGVCSIPDKDLRPFIGVKSFVISKSSRNQKESIKILKYLTDYKRQRIFSRHDTFIPVNKKLFLYSERKEIKAVRESVAKGVLIPPKEKMSEFWMKFDIVIDLIIIKNKNNIYSTVHEEFKK